MEQVIERKTDYFMRYTADIPADEASRHQAFNVECQCKPETSFDEENGWRTIIHNRLEK